MIIHTIAIWWRGAFRDHYEIVFPNNAGEIKVTLDNIGEYVRSRHPSWSEYLAYDTKGEVVTYVIAEV